MSVLVKIITGDKTSLIEVTKKPIILGRSPEANFIIQDPECSGKHCELKIIDNMAVLKDLGSKNGTFVNGSFQKETVIYLGDEIRIGSTKIFLESIKMSQDEISHHTLNVTRKQTQMINLEDLGFEKLAKVKLANSEKVPELDPKIIKPKTNSEKVPWWKKLFKK